MERPFIYFGSGINVGPWTVFLGEINLKYNSVFSITILSGEPVSFCLVARSTGETWEETNGVKSIVLLTNVFWTYNTSPNWNLCLLISQILLFFVVQKLNHGCVISFNVLELRVSHGDIDGIISSIISISFNHSFETSQLFKFLVIFETIEKSKEILPMLLLSLIDMSFENIVILII